MYLISPSSDDYHAVTLKNNCPDNIVSEQDMLNSEWDWLLWWFWFGFFFNLTSLLQSVFIYFFFILHYLWNTEILWTDWDRWEMIIIICENDLNSYQGHLFIQIRKWKVLSSVCRVPRAAAFAEIWFSFHFFFCCYYEEQFWISDSTVCGAECV